MNLSVLLSSIVFTLSIIFSSVSSLANIGIINFVIASIITWIIEWLLRVIKGNQSFEFSSERTLFIDIIYVCIAVVLLLHLVAIFSVLLSSLSAARIENISIYVLLILLGMGCFMSFSIDPTSMIHIGRIISYLIIGMILIILFNIPYNMLTLELGTISIVEVLKILPICLSHTLYILYLKFQYVKESLIGNIIGSLFLVLLMVFISSTDLEIHNHEVTTLISSMTLIGTGSLTERIDVFIICMILAVEAYQICIIGNILGKLCVSNIGHYVMKLIVGSVVIVGILIGLSPLTLEMILVFTGLLTSLFAVII